MYAAWGKSKMNITPQKRMKVHLDVQNDHIAELRHRDENLDSDSETVVNNIPEVHGQSANLTPIEIV